MGVARSLSFLLVPKLHLESGRMLVMILGNCYKRVPKYNLGTGGKALLVLPCFLLMLLSSCFLLTDPITTAADQKERIATTPEVDHEVFALLETVSVDAMRIAQEREYERPEALSLLRELLAPVIERVGRERVVAALLVAEVLAERPSEYASDFHRLHSTMLGVLEPSAEEKVRILGPFWPPDEEVLNGRRLEHALQYTIGSDLQAATLIAPEVFMVELKSAWSRGDHRLDGLVDLLYDSHPVIARDLFLRATLADYFDADSLDIDSDSMPRVMIPNVHDTYYLAHPEALPEGTIPKAIDFLRQEAKSDIFWSRLMVAAIVDRIPYLRDPDIEAALRADPHWLIQRRLAYLDEEAEPAEE